ncbi:MAG: NADH-quinone oxidoreductase subunit J, partial [Roseiarcus sp.]
MTPADATTPGGFLLVLAILAPSAGILASFPLGGRTAERILLVLSPIGLALAAAIAALVWRSGQPIAYVVAGVAPPLGIALRADGISSVMLVATALLVPAAAVFARASFATPPDVLETRKGLTFWIMLQAIWA